MRQLSIGLLLTFTASIFAGCDSTPTTPKMPTPSELTPEKGVVKPGSGSRPSNKMDPNL